MYVICSEERFVEIPSPNECDKILKIPNEQTEPTDYMANCSTDTSIASIPYDGMTSHRDVMTRRCDMLAAA